MTVLGEGGDRSIPATLELERGDSYTITISAEGYRSEQIRLEENIRGGILAGDIIFGLVPVLIDGLTGNWKELSPDRINLQLDPVSASADPIEIQFTANDGNVTVSSAQPVVVEVRESN